jgi:tetratricopeptide (TPR) repeat protein
LVFCPEEGLLATGDLFVSRMRPPYLKTSTVEELPHWIEALNTVLDGGDSIRHVIPGHGDFLSADDLRVTREYLLSEKTRVENRAPALPLFQEMLDEQGPGDALPYLEELADRDDLFLLEGDLVSLGYGFLYRDRAPAQAVLVFKSLTRLFPDSWNAWDCLGEASVESGDLAMARKAYTRSVELNPENHHAREALRALG